MDKLTKTYRIYFDANALHLIVFNSAVIDLDTAKEIESIVKTFSKNLKSLKLIDARAPFTIEPEAQNYFHSQRNKKKTLAQAILVGSMTKQQTMDFFLEMKSKKLPTKVFVDYDAAIDWLNAFYY
ncbi:MAG: hypothetical protein KA163_09690 [Bacteroidia bacterium]|nr:hypothetical protein [Bacteroidia bacterium]